MENCVSSAALDAARTRLDAAEAAKEKFSGLLLACLAHLDEA